MYDVVVIGGGPAGMAAALKARDFVDRVAIIERNEYLGGILPQCIHNGFGLHYLKEDLTGPEFASYLEDRVRVRDIEVFLGAYVEKIEKNGHFRIFLQSEVIESKTVVFATGCKERTRFMLNISGDRPSGVFTAGLVQALLDLHGYIPGKKAVILGSGDIGLIVARRLAMEGVEVVGVFEILPYPSGLPRNIVQCLDDYNIPLYLNHTILEIRGKKRVECVVVGEIENGEVKNKRCVECDTVVIAAGLVPNMQLLLNLGAQIDEATDGPVVNEFLETTVEGAFACGNVLVVNDLVDYAVEQGEMAGKNAALRARGKLPLRNRVRLTPGEGIKFVVPQMVSPEADVSLVMRVSEPMERATIHVNGVSRKYAYLRPSEMVFFKLPANSLKEDAEVWAEWQ